MIQIEDYINKNPSYMDKEQFEYMLYLVERLNDEYLNTTLEKNND